MKQLANLMSNANGTVRFLKTFKSSVFRKKNGFSEKNLKFSKIVDGNNFAVQCVGLSKVSQNVQISGFGSIKEYFGFSRKTDVF